MSRRRRIWVELLPPKVLAEPATLQLLDRFGLEPIIAIPPEREDGDLLESLRRVARAGLAVGLWPLLSDEEGYWPSASNAARFRARVEEVLRFAARAGVKPRTVAIDLEPRLPITRALLEGPRVSTLAKGLVGAFTPEAEEVRLRAKHSFGLVRRELRSQGIESLAAIWPVQLVDFHAPRPLLGALLGTPVRLDDWDVTCPMLYSSIIRSLAPARAEQLTRWAYRSIAKSRGQAALSVSLGLVGTGKLGDEPVLEAPERLELDVQNAKSAGLDDLALFSLEGVIADERPERWLRVFS